jgi:hypothetical protein
VFLSGGLILHLGSTGSIHTLELLRPSRRWQVGPTIVRQPTIVADLELVLAPEPRCRGHHLDDVAVPVLIDIEGWFAEIRLTELTEPVEAVALSDACLALVHDDTLVGFHIVVSPGGEHPKPPFLADGRR